MNYSQDPLILSIDIGTSSARAGVYDAQGNALPWHHQIPYRMTHSPDGGAFIEPERLLGLAAEAMDGALRPVVENGLRIHAVGLCTFWHNVLGTDGQGKPLTPLLSWNDNRPERVLPELRKRMEPSEFTRRTGCPFHASYLPAKIAWLHEAMPEEARQVRYWMSFGEYLFLRFFGERVVSVSMASGSGCMNGETSTWDETILSILPVGIEQFSPIQVEPEGLQGLLPEYSDRWLPLQGAVWHPALGDGACSNIGCGCATPDRVTLMVGTSGAMRTAWRGAYEAPPPGLWCYRIDGKRPIQGGALSNGGNLFQWMRQTLQLPPLERLEPDIAAMKPDAHGLTLLPYFAGQRSPRWNANSTAAILGLRTSTTPMEILRAGLEAVAYRFSLIHSRLSPLLPEEHTLVASGGALQKSTAWTQIMADVMGRPVGLSTVEEASCRGAALYALERLGALSDLSDAETHIRAVIEPNPEAREVYRSALDRHLRIEEALDH